MELETEIPIWYKGKVKWISNLTSRSTCSDVIQAILSSLSLDYRSSQINEDYILYECWRGVERPLKSRCRLLKLWNSWAGESENVTLTLRCREEESLPTHILIRTQEKKLKKLKRQLKRTDQEIEYLNKSENKKEILTYLNISRSIIRLNNQIKNEEKLILRLTSDIKHENDLVKTDFNQLLFDVNQTLITSRKLTILSDQLDQQMNQTNEHIDQKLTLLDELELDYALLQNIDIDSLDEQEDQQSNEIISIKTLTVQTRPTAIVEPSLSRFQSKEYFSTNQISFDNISKEDYQFQSTNNDESDTGISSIHSNEEQLVTLV